MEEYNEIDFEKEFKDLNSNKPKITVESIPKNILTIVFYFLREIIAIILVLLFSLFPSLTVSSDEDAVLRNVARDPLGITLTDPGDPYVQEYSQFLKIVGLYDSFHIVANISFSSAEDFNISYSYFSEILDGNTPYNVYFTEQMANRYGTDAKITVVVSDFTHLGLGLLQILGLLFPLIGIVIIQKNVIISDFKRTKQLKIKFFSTVISGLGIAIIGSAFIGMIINFLTTYVFKLPSESANQMTLNFYSQGVGLILLSVASVLLAPIVEEMVFRKAVFGLFKSPKVGLIVSSIAFGLIHVTNEFISGSFLAGVLFGIQYITAGFLFGYIYIKTNKNIVISIIVHALYNLFATIVNLIGAYI